MNLIDKLKQNPRNRIGETNMNCPICGCRLYTVEIGISCICDGNSVFYCKNSEEHRFWNHPFEQQNILHLNKYASPESNTSYQDYKFINGIWNEIIK